MTSSAVPRRVLLVDDEQDILTVTRTALEVMGDFVTDTCSSALEALGYLEKFHPDLIVLDVMMPDLDGISFVRRLKKMPRFAHIPVIFLTARTQTEDIKSYLSEGVFDVVSKPFDPEELVQCLGRAWKETPHKGQSSDELARKLQHLQLLYQQQLPLKIREIETVWQQIQNAPSQPDTVRKFYRLIHSMTGAGATFGFNTLSIMARILENFLRPFADESKAPDAEQQEEISRIVGLLKEASLKPEAEISLPEATLPVEPKERRSDKLVFLFDEDRTALTELVRQLQFFGYDVEGFSEFDVLSEAVDRRLPTILVMSARLGTFPKEGIAAAARLKAAHHDAFPLIFVAETEDLETHLTALRGGGKAFFVKPFDLGELVDKIDLLAGQHLNDPYRILIVEDDAQLAAYYELTLERAGITCQVVGDALQVLGPIRSFRPDLILLDIYMANCNGLELAAMLRQRESLLGISIVFLSTEAALETQSAGIALGAEDYLTKPIQAEHLVSVLLPRLERSRILRDIMDKDGLTGLLNHTKTKERLESQLRQAQNTRSAFVFVMIDIDHFKKVNDTHGHASGDRILKSLARLLKQRLRRGDIIGRYGGEEFAVILPDTVLEEARTVFDDIRTSFGAVNHTSEEGDFRVTFSCGLASWPEFPDVISLSDAADAALYRAKGAGRNRVVAANDGRETGHAV